MPLKHVARKMVPGMNTVTEFRVGEKYTNDQIRFSLGLENLGGIRPSVDAKKNLLHLAIMTAAEESGKLSSENPYNDRIEGDILIYTAQGREGDQLLSGRNKRLLEQYSLPIPFYGFINLGRQTYRFLGLLELLRHYQEIQADTKGTLRKVWLFELRVHKHPELIPISQAQIICSELLAESRRKNPLTDLEREVSESITANRNGSDENPSFEVEAVRSRLLQVQPYQFEHLVRALMERSGFINVAVTPPSGDGGIDINAYVAESNDFFAGTHIQAQVKRWRHSVGNVEINNFRGALNTTAKGVFLTTSHYTRAAILEAKHEFKPCITLIDGTRLSKMIIQSRIDLSSFS